MTYQIGDVVRIKKSGSALSSIRKMIGKEFPIQAFHGDFVQINNFLFFKDDIEFVNYKNPYTEYKITLHTEAGDVTTSYPFSMEEDAFRMISSYRKDGKKFTVTTE